MNVIFKYSENNNNQTFTQQFLNYYKKGGSIHIKKKNRGKFTEYCGGEVTNECIQKAKKSKNPTLRKRATFAANSRSWSHKRLFGGVINII